MCIHTFVRAGGLLYGQPYIYTITDNLIANQSWPNKQQQLFAMNGSFFEHEEAGYHVSCFRVIVVVRSPAL